MAKFIESGRTSKENLAIARRNTDACNLGGPAVDSGIPHSIRNWRRVLLRTPKLGEAWMKRRLGYYGISAGVVLGILTLVMTPAAAQEGQEGKPSEPGAAKSKPQSVPKGGA